MEGSDTSTKSRRESPSLAWKMSGSVFLICVYIYMYTYNVYMHAYSYTVIHIYIHISVVFWYVLILCIVLFGCEQNLFPKLSDLFCVVLTNLTHQFSNKQRQQPTMTSPACPTDLAKATPKGSNEPWPTLRAEWAHRDLPPVRISIPWNMWKPVLTSLFHGFWQPV